MLRSLKVLVCLVVVGCGILPTRLPPGRCRSQGDCGSGLTCDLSSEECVCAGPSCGGGGGGGGSGGGGSGDWKCTANSQCQDPPRPFCNADGACVGCSELGAQACAGDAQHPVCGPAGACVECNANSQCTKDPTKPVCDLGANKCAPCTHDSDCAGKGGPGVCRPDDGHCATDAETIYVAAPNGACSSAPDGHASQPFCTLHDGLAVVVAGRALVVVRGAVNSLGAAVTAPAPGVTIVGQQEATIASGTQWGLRVTGATVTVQGITFKTGLDVGVIAEQGAMLRLDRVAVIGNAGGGILLDGAAFDIENTTVTNNGPGTFNGLTSWGGILVNKPPMAGPAKLQFVTVQNNNPVGVACSSAINGMGVLASGNVGVDVIPTCGLSPCSTAGTTCGAQP